MVTAEQARAHVRPDLVALVEHYRSTGHPKMHAYDRVASRIGRSSAWIQRVLSRDDDAAVGLHDFLNIRAAYDRLCARIEAAADTLEANNNKLREESHAARKGTQTTGASGVGLVPPVVDQDRQRLTAPSSRHDTR